MAASGRSTSRPARRSGTSRSARRARTVRSASRRCCRSRSARPNNGGSVVTAGGLIFIAAATDNLIRAIDIETGKVVWQDELPAGGQATPMTFEAGRPPVRRDHGRRAPLHGDAGRRLCRGLRAAPELDLQQRAAATPPAPRLRRATKHPRTGAFPTNRRRQPRSARAGRNRASAGNRLRRAKSAARSTGERARRAPVRRRQPVAPIDSDPLPANTPGAQRLAIQLEGNQVFSVFPGRRVHADRARPRARRRNRAGKPELRLNHADHRQSRCHAGEAQDAVEGTGRADRHHRTERVAAQIGKSAAVSDSKRWTKSATCYNASQAICWNTFPSENQPIRIQVAALDSAAIMA